MLTVLIKECRCFFRQKSNLLYCFLFPSVLVFLLGSLLQQIEVSDYAVGDLSVQYYSDNADPAAYAGLETFLDQMTQEQVFTAHEASSPEEAAAAVEDESSAAVIVMQGSEVLLKTGTDSVKNRTVRALLDSYLQMQRSYVAAAALDPAALATIELPQEPLVVAKDLGVNRSMIDYYAIAMLVMMLFMGTLVSATTIFRDETTWHTADRLALSPVSRPALFFGKLFGSMPSAGVQILAIMLTSTLLFDAHYCATWQDNLLLGAMLFCVAMALIALGILLSLLVRFSLNGILMPILWAMMFFSGTFAKQIHIDGVSDHLPVYVIQQASFDLTLFGKTEGACHVILISLITFAVCMTAGVIWYSRRKRV